MILTAQILDYLEEHLRADPAALGEPHKEPPEELAERHERVQAAALAALARLLEALLPDKAQEGGPPGALADGRRFGTCQGPSFL